MDIEKKNVLLKEIEKKEQILQSIKNWYIVYSIVSFLKSSMCDNVSVQMVSNSC